MRNWDTTLMGLVAALGIVLRNVGVDPVLSDAITVVGTVLMGFLAKSFRNTGTGM